MRRVMSLQGVDVGIDPYIVSIVYEQRKPRYNIAGLHKINYLQPKKDTRGRVSLDVESFNAV